MTIKELSKVSTTPLRILGNIDIINKAEGEKHIIAGYASVAIIDQEEQFIPIETLKEGIQTLINDPAYSNLMLVHKNIQVGKILRSYGKYETKIDERGFFIVAEIRSDLKTANEVWKAILNKEFNGFSIGCEVLLSHKQCDKEKCVTILDKINIFEVSICQAPINQESGFIVISKSMYDKNNKSVCVKCDTINEKEMTEEVIKETVVPISTPETPTKSTDEVLESLQREVNAMKAILQDLAKPKDAVPQDKPVPPETPLPPTEQPQEPPKEQVPTKWSNEEDMALFMLDYLIANPKSSAQDIAKAWIETKKVPVPPKPEETNPQTPTQAPTEPSPVQSNYSYPGKKDTDELKLSIDRLIQVMTVKNQADDLKLAIKSRDDQIDALKKQVEIVNKSVKPEPKTIQAVNTIIKESPIVVEHGTVYSNE